MTKKTPLLLLLLDLIHVLTGAFIFQCPYETQTTFEKRVAVRPARGINFLDAVFSFRDGTPQTWSSIECVKKCLALAECHSVLVLHQTMECIGFPFVESDSLIIDNDANYFVKQCLNVPSKCRSKLWTVESLNGYRLLSQDSILQTIPNITNEECSHYLIQTTGSQDPIKSAQFQLNRAHDTYNGFQNGNSIECNINGIGKCILTSEDKFTEPESFRVAGKESWYKENQCVEDFPKPIDRCSYEEYYNQTLKHFDVIIHGISTSECKRRCESEIEFNCRGFTTLPYSDGKSYYSYTGGGEDAKDKTCLLHSEDMLTHGSWLLVKRPDIIYYRRVTCLNVSVICSPTSMLVTYIPRSDFRGRIYVSGHSESCSSSGNGRGQPTRLTIAFNSPDCGVNQAYALSDDGVTSENKTLMYTMLVIQNNPIIQAQGDRFVRVGCVAPPTFNLTLAADISVSNESEDNAVNGGVDGSSSIPASSVINTTGIVNIPKVRMYIINDSDDGNQAGKMTAGAVSLGENIELRIEADSPKNDIDIHAYHLVASSQFGDSSVLLLDGRGCPTGQVDFPALVHSRIPGDGRTPGVVRLSARFRAFRFPNSQVVKFSVMVQFCAGSCEEINCENTRTFLNRNTRSVTNENTAATIENMSSTQGFTPLPQEFQYENASIRILNKPLMKSINEPRSSNIVVASSESGGRVREICREINESHESKIPLELSLIVASNDVISADSLIYGENNKILVASVEDSKTSYNHMICIHEALFISITFIWLLVQIIILAACMVVIKRYRSFVEENQPQKDYHSFDNLGFDSFSTTRRVHWPDQQHIDSIHHAGEI